MTVYIKRKIKIKWGVFKLNKNRNKTKKKIEKNINCHRQQIRNCIENCPFKNEINKSTEIGNFAKTENEIYEII